MLRSRSLCVALTFLAVLLIRTTSAKEIAKASSKTEAEAAALVDRAIEAQLNGRTEERAAQAGIKNRSRLRPGPLALRARAAQWPLGRSGGSRAQRRCR